MCVTGSIDCFIGMLGCAGSLRTVVECCRDHYCDKPAVESPYRKQTKLRFRTGASIGVEYAPDERRYADHNRDGQRANRVS